MDFIEAFERLGMSRKDLAKEIGVSHRTLDGYFIGRKVPEPVIKLIVMLIQQAYNK
tara:strand:+ start:1489 stop:1656 length:168 start_codon:yes stop_codon:yes gene_type:complete